MKKKIFGTIFSLVIGVVLEIVAAFLFLLVFGGFDGATNALYIIIPGLIAIGLAGLINWYFSKSWVLVIVTVVILLFLFSQITGFSLLPR